MGGAAATSSVRMLGEIFGVVLSLPHLSVLSHQYFLLKKLLTFKKDLVFDIAIACKMTPMCCIGAVTSGWWMSPALWDLSCLHDKELY